MSVNTSLPENPLDVKTKTIEIPTRAGIFTYDVTRLTEQCILTTANHTGAIRQFNSDEALFSFFSDLRQHLYNKYGVL